MPINKERRAWFQFSLRTMFAVVTIIALLLGRERIREQSRRVWEERIYAGIENGTIVVPDRRSGDEPFYFDEPWTESDAREYKALFPSQGVYFARGKYWVEIP